MDSYAVVLNSYSNGGGGGSHVRQGSSGSAEPADPSITAGSEKTFLLTAGTRRLEQNPASSEKCRDCEGIPGMHTGSTGYRSCRLMETRTGDRSVDAEPTTT
jgi:hypothetical protein